MITSFEPELRELGRAGVLDEETVARSITLDQGEVFSLFEELRVSLYIAVALIATGLGILIKNNLDRIGPVTLIAALALASGACYAGVIRTHLSGRPRTIGGDYLLLLGALILSADLGYAESQFHWLGAQWSRHLLLLAVLHAATAYWLNSRLVLSVALTSLAGWLGVEHQMRPLMDLSGSSVPMSWRALTCAGVILVWRIAHERLRAPQPFSEVFEHFIANLACWAALIWCADDQMRVAGAIVLTVLAVMSILKGLKEAQEIFVVYGVAYGALGYCVMAADLHLTSLATAFAILIVTTGAAILLWVLHKRLNERAT